MKSNQFGYSLVEVLITVSVVSILITVITGFSISMFRQYAINSATADLLADANLIVNIINNDIRLAANVDVQNRWEDSNAPNAPANPYSWTSNNQVLILSTAAENNDGEIIFADTSNYVPEKNNRIYFTEENQLIRRFLASDVEGNSAQTTCPQSIASESCPADNLLTESLDIFDVTYIDSLGDPTTPDNARAVEVSLGLSEERFGQLIRVEQSTRMVFRND